VAKTHISSQARKLLEIHFCSNLSLPNLKILSCKSNVLHRKQAVRVDTSDDYLFNAAVTQIRLQRGPSSEAGIPHRLQLEAAASALLGLLLRRGLILWDEILGSEHPKPVLRVLLIISSHARD